MDHTLLLADDSLTIRRVIELTFAEEDVTVTTVSDGRRAMERIASDRPDIVLADVGMSEPGGYEIAEFVKGSPDLQHIPVILLTAAFQPIDEARARAVRCDDVLAKPFELPLLVSRVKELLRQAGSSPVGEAVPPAPSEGEIGSEGEGRQEQPAGLEAEAVAQAETAAGDIWEGLAAAVSAPADAAAPASLEDHFDSIDAGTPYPAPPVPADSWSSQAEAGRMSLDDYFDLVDDTARRPSSGGAPLHGASFAIPPAPPAGIPPEGLPPDEAVQQERLAGAPGNPADAAPQAALPDAVTRAFLALLEASAIPSAPDAVERAVRLLLDRGGAVG